jgi:hypothetical protein
LLYYLKISGLIVGRLTELDRWAFGGAVSSSSFLNTSCSADFELFWRTIVADTDHHGRRPAPAWYGDALTHMLEHHQADAYLTESSDENFALRAFSHRVESVMQNRRLSILLTEPKKSRMLVGATGGKRGGLGLHFEWLQCSGSAVEKAP